MPVAYIWYEGKSDMYLSQSPAYQRYRGSARQAALAALAALVHPHDPSTLLDPLILSPG